MNISRNGLIGILLIGMVIGGSIGAYFFYSKVSALESQMEALSIDFTEFELEEKHYQLEAVYYNLGFYRLYLNASQTIEMWFKQGFYRNFNATFIQVSKLELREKFHEILWEIEAIPYLVIYTIPDRETICLIELGSNTRQVTVYWWSAKAEK